MALATLTAWAQTDLKVGTTPGSISPSAVLEAASTTKGFLMPRMTTAQMNAISSPANGLQIYNTTDSCIYIYRNSAWLSTCSPTYAMAWGLLGNSGTTAGTNFVGTTDAQDLVFKRNNTEGLRLSSGKTINTGDLTVSNRLIAGNMGTLDSLSLINAVGTQTSYTNNVHGLRADFTVTPPSGYLYSTFGGYNKLTIKGTNGGNYHAGSLGYLSNDNTGTVPVAVGAGGTIFHNSVGTIAGAYGLQSSIYNNSTGTITNAYGTYSQIYNLSTGTITNAYGNYITPFVKSGGTMTNAYGLYIDNQTAATNNYGIYVNGASTRALHINSGTSYFGGNVGINTTSPTYKLDIDAQTGGTGNPLRLLGLNAGATSDSIISSNSGILRRLSIGQIVGSSAWALLGNAGTVDGTNFIGTTDNVPFNIRVNNQKAGRIDNTNANAFFGYQSGNVTTGTNNAAFGDQTLAANTTGFANSAFGSGALLNNTTGYVNSAFGREALTFNTTGKQNAAFGVGALKANISGDNNNAFGYQALVANTTGAYNNSFGYQNLVTNTTGSYNTSYGHTALYSSTTASYNTAIGAIAMFSNTTGSNNTAVGNEVLRNNTTAWSNSALGYRTLFNNTTGNANTAIGDSALVLNTTGANNIGIGYQAGSTITTGSNNIAIGQGAQVPTATASNQLSIGNWIYGVGGLIGINTSTPQYKLDIDAQTGSTGNPLRLLGLNAGATSDSIISSNSGVLRRLSINQILGNAWNITGNAGTTAGTNFIGTTDGQALAFRTNNTEWMRMSTTGSVGLGLTSPSVKLHQDAGTATATYHKFTANTTTGQAITDGFDIGIDATGNAIFDQNENLPMIFYTNSAERMRILAGGNIGLGIATPTVRLHQNNGNATATYHKFTAGTTTGTTATDGFDVGVDGSGNAVLAQRENLSMLFNTNNTERARITEGGYFGIGTNAPSVNFEVVGLGKIQTASTFNLFLNGGNTTNTGTYNTIVGLNAFGNATTAEYSTGFGAGALNQVTTGAYNAAFGNGALGATTTGSSNIAFGGGALQGNTTGTHNGALGIQALAASVSGTHNLAVGNYALSSLASGNSNIGLGWGAGGNITSGSDNIIIGFQINPPSLTGSGQLNIGNLLYGTSLGTGSARSTGNIGINTTTPQYKLDIDAQSGSAGDPLRLLGLNAGATSDSIISSNSGILRRLSINQILNNAWNITGNAGTTAGTNFIGTTDAQDLVVKTNNTERMRVSSAGYIGINNSTPTYRLHIEDPTGSDADILARNYKNGTGGIAGLLLQSANGTKSASTPLIGGDQLGVIRFGGYDGSGFNDLHAGEIAGFATQNWTSSAHGTGLWFRTIHNDSLNSRARMYLTHDGKLGLGFDSYYPQYKLDIDAQSGSAGDPLRLLGLNAGATSDSIISSNSGVLRRLSINQILGNAWNITGNAGTTAGTNFIGTTDNQGLVVKTNNSTALTVPVNPMGGLINFASNRSGAVYPSYAGYYNWTLPGNIDTSFSLIGGIGYNDLFAIYGKVPTSTIATDGELHIASGDDGVEPIIFEQYNQVGTTFTERMRIHSNGNMGIGANAPDYKLQVEEPGGYNGDIAVRLYNTNNAAYLPSLIFQTARGTKSAATTVTSGTVLGAVRYGGYDGTAFSDIYAGEMRGNATENWTTSAHGTSLNFGTIANGTTTLLDRMIINQNGYVGIGTNTPNQQLEITAAMRMPATTTSTTGVIYKDANRFIHNYKPAANDGNNTFVGINAGNFTMSSATSWLASGNTGVGTNTLTANTSGGYNTAIGNAALTANTTGSYNTALGNATLVLNTTGQANTAVGNNALNATTSSNNTAVGNAALYLNTSGTANTAVGESTLNKNTTGNQNTAVGQSSMKENLTGANNTALGLSALQSNTSGNNNVAVGVSALVNNLTGGNNVVVGYTAMSATTSSNNVGLGYGAGLGTTSGGNNTFVGYNTGSTNSTGSNNTFLGYQANVSSGALSNATAIGNGATVNASNKIRLGNASVTLVETYGSFVTISDRRLKTNITNNNIGLDFIKAVRPVNYELKSQKGIVYDGFVAQEIDSIMRKLNIKTFSGLSKPADTEGGYYTVSYATFVVPLVNAVKELDEKSEKLKVNTETLINENARLKAELERIKSENAALKASIDKNTADIEAIKAVLHKQ